MDLSEPSEVGFQVLVYHVRVRNSGRARDQPPLGEKGSEALFLGSPF